MLTRFRHPHPVLTARGAWNCLVWIVPVCLFAWGTQAKAVESPAADTYRAGLRYLHEARNYRACKNSYVLGGERLAGLPLAVPTGQSLTLLNVRGSGSVRHIWATWRKQPTPCPYRYRFYVDGEAEPSIEGRLDDLIAAAQRVHQPWVLNPGGIANFGSHNLYLPIPFEKSLRLDVYAERDSIFMFVQVDYRLDDTSLQGVRLIQKGNDASLELSYAGPLAEKSPPRAPVTTVRQAVSRCVQGNGRAVLAPLQPGIVRQFAVESVRRHVRMRLYFDGQGTPAVDVDLADFFGPFQGSALCRNVCYFPMPFRNRMEIEISGARTHEQWNFQVEVEPAAEFAANWRYFHAKSQTQLNVSGYTPYQALHTRGSGHWVGMSLYGTGHDHGGGDFAVTDGRGTSPSFLHGVNGEDYFSFAWFGSGANLPYSEAFDNDTGRMRLHLENPYPFRESLDLSWAVLPGVSPRSVSYWYQDTPHDLTLTPEQVQGWRWHVFGPVPAPVRRGTPLADLSDPSTLFAALPDPARLDAGKAVTVYRVHDENLATPVRRRQEGTFRGWAEQTAVGSHLNLTYIYRHVMDLGPYGYIGYEPRCMMAQTQIHAAQVQPVTLRLCTDEPVELFLNGERLIQHMQIGERFHVLEREANLRQGKNCIWVRLLDTPLNGTMAWAAVHLTVLDAQGTDITSTLTGALRNSLP